MLYKLILAPLVLLFDVIYAFAFRAIGNAGLSIIFLSLAMNLLVLPLYRRADAMQEEERRVSMALQPGIDHIRRTFKGNERFMMQQTYYRQNHYKPYYALRGSLSLLLEVPFFIAAYRFLSGLSLLKGVAFGPIPDLARPDGLLNIAGHAVHLLPILMTAVNIVSGAIYTRGMPLKSKLQLYGMALVFLVLLYPSPSGLVFYWTLNNVFSLVKNIFYRLKNPRKVLSALCAALGLSLLAFLLFVHPMGSLRKQLILIAVALALLAPLALALLRRGRPTRGARPEKKGDALLFNLCCAILTVLTGALIPSSVVRASPTEFINVISLRPPALYVLTAALLAAGAFLVWGNIFYRLASPAGQRAFSLAALAAAGVAILDFMLFGRDYGNMSSMLQYDNSISIGPSGCLLNMAAALALAAALWLLWRWRASLVRSVAVAGALAISVMAISNVSAIQGGMAEIADTVDLVAVQGRATLPLSREGKNVIVLMLDRGISRFFPFLLEERPELKRQFDGFTFYPNTLSYGSCTVVGSPALYGGYEYIPENINRRRDMTLVEKHNEALRVLPVSFLNAGFKVTVCDPPLAGYSTMPNLGIYDAYPDIRRFNTKGAFSIDPEGEAARNEAVWERNLFCYGVFRASPLLFQPTLYNNGRYNESDAKDASAALIQERQGMSRATGVDKGFMRAYTALDSLPEITRVETGDGNTFLAFSNDTAHDAMMLKEPELEPAGTVDNTEYDAAHAVRRAADGSKLKIRSQRQMIHYQCNGAALVKLGKWFDFMRENGVYDNTRIIIVADHGASMGDLFHMRLGKSGRQDLLFYNPLLLVKDFDSRGLRADDTFMTNADTPTLAFSGLIDDPVNPFTGDPITDEAKRAPVQHTVYTHHTHAREYAGDLEFTDLTWFENRNDCMDRDAWRMLGEGRLPPGE